MALNISPDTTSLPIPQTPVWAVANTGRRDANPYSTYEALKAALPPLSPAEYEAAVRRIAKGLGL